MPCRLIVASISPRFRRPRRSSTPDSPGNRARPLATPWVRLAAQNPPLRPVAAEATRPASSSTTSRPGSRSLASKAVQSPENPPPTTARSVPVETRNPGRAAGRSGRSSQNGTGAAPDHESYSSRRESMITFSVMPPRRRSSQTRCRPGRAETPPSLCDRSATGRTSCEPGVSWPARYASPSTVMLRCEGAAPPVTSVCSFRLPWIACQGFSPVPGCHM
jgi:hypothetical protein